MSETIRNYHRFLFAWHGRKFFRFRSHLSPAELEYLEVCFALPNSFDEVSETGYSHFSYYSYSHRVEGNTVNSSRLAYGSVLHPEPAWQAARPVVQERKLNLDPFCVEHPDSRFYGLGWDIEEGQFKVYFRVVNMASLPAHLLELARGAELSQHRREGLLAFTYLGRQLHESKLYLYPLENAPGVQGEARMLTNLRGEVEQFDVGDSKLWAERLNPVGRRILALYQERGEELDTIAYTDPDHYTLYFP